MLELEMKDLLWDHPSKFFNEPLKQFARETSSDVGRADVVFEDRFGRLLIVEVKRGKLPRGAIDQLLDYFGMMKLRYPDKPVEMMVVAWTIPPERRLTCEARDIECREISEKTFRDIAAEVGYKFASETIQPPQSMGVSSPASMTHASVEPKHESGSTGHSIKPHSHQETSRSFCRGAMKKASSSFQPCSTCSEQPQITLRLPGNMRVVFRCGSIFTVWALPRWCGAIQQPIEMVDTSHSDCFFPSIAR